MPPDKTSNYDPSGGNKTIVLVFFFSMVLLLVCGIVVLATAENKRMAPDRARNIVRLTEGEEIRWNNAGCAYSLTAANQPVPLIVPEAPGSTTGKLLCDPTKVK